MYEVIDQIKRHAVTIQHLTGEVETIKREQEQSASNYKEKLQTEELRYSRLLSETTDKLLGNSERIDILENQLGNIRECARTNGWTEEASLTEFLRIAMAERKAMFEDRAQISQESPEATRNALRNVTADRDRIRIELAAILAEANKSGRCNGDPVQLLKQGQADLDALRYLEREKAKVDALVSNLQVEIAEARAGQQKAEPEDMKAQLREAKQDYEIVRIQLDRIAKAAKRCGRTDKESVIDFMNRQQREKGQVHTECKQACEQLERIQKAANETHRCGLDPIALIRKGQFDHMKIVEFRKEVVRIQTKHDALVATHSANEVDRLSALVAPLEFIDHMKRIGTEQKAALAAEVAELKQTITEKNEALGKIRSQLNAALDTVSNQSAAIAEAQRVVDKYTGAAAAATKLKEWASTVRHKVMVKVVHDTAMEEYDNIIKELDGEAAK